MHSPVMNDACMRHTITDQAACDQRQGTIASPQQHGIASMQLGNMALAACSTVFASMAAQHGITSMAAQHGRVFPEPHPTRPHWCSLVLWVILVVPSVAPRGRGAALSEQRNAASSATCMVLGLSHLHVARAQQAGMGWHHTPPFGTALPELPVLHAPSRCPSEGCPLALRCHAVPCCLTVTCCHAAHAHVALVTSSGWATRSSAAPNGCVTYSYHDMYIGV